MALTQKYVSSAGGGAHDGSSEADAFSWTEMVTDINAGGKAGNVYNVKGAISRGASDTISGSGSSTAPVVIRGYTTVIGDGHLGRTGGFGPLVTTNMPTITYADTFRLICSGTWIVVESLEVIGNANGNLLQTGGDGAVRGCRVVNASTGASADAMSAGSRECVIDNDLEMSGASGGLTTLLVLTATNVRAYGNRIKGGPTSGISISTGSAIIAKNLIYDCAGAGIIVTGTAGVLHDIDNTITGCADAVDIVTGSTPLQFSVGGMKTDNSGYGIDANNVAVGVCWAHTRTRDNSAATNLGTDWIAATGYGNVTTDTGGLETDYADAGSDDYNLISGSPAWQAGHPAYSSMGAIQPESATPDEIAEHVWTTAGRTLTA